MAVSKSKKQEILDALKTKFEGSKSIAFTTSNT